MIARIITGVLVFSAVIAAVVTGSQLTAQDVPATQGTTVSVAPARQDVACPGPLVTPATGTGDQTELGGAATGISRSTFLTGTLRTMGSGQASDALVGAAVERVTGGDITGLAAVTCAAPRTDQWIVAGATTVGASARLVLSNPSAVSVETTVTAYGEIGELDTRQVAIGPDAQQMVLLEGLTIDVAALAVHITSTGTGVVAALQDSRITGFQPSGTDWATASAEGTELAIPGVGTAGSATQTATVRLLAPEGATASMTLSTPAGEAAWEGVAALNLEPGVAVEVAIPAVDVGTVTISADADVVAGVVVTRTRPATAGVAGDTAKEFRWIPAQLAADDNERSAVAVGYDERVVVYGQQEGTFTLTDAEGKTVGSAELAPGATAVVPLNVVPGTVLTASGPYTWSVLVSDGEFLAAMVPVRTTIDNVDIVVEQRRYVPSP
jgi:hypothetical protein